MPSARPSRHHRCRRRGLDPAVGGARQPRVRRRCRPARCRRARCRCSLLPNVPVAMMTIALDATTASAITAAPAQPATGQAVSFQGDAHQRDARHPVRRDRPRRRAVKLLLPVKVCVTAASAARPRSSLPQLQQPPPRACRAIAVPGGATRGERPCQRERLLHPGWNTNITQRTGCDPRNARSGRIGLIGSGVSASAFR